MDPVVKLNLTLSRISGDLRSPGGPPASLVQQRLAAAREEQQGFGQDQLAGDHQLQLVSVM